MQEIVFSAKFKAKRVVLDIPNVDIQFEHWNFYNCFMLNTLRCNIFIKDKTLATLADIKWAILLIVESAKFLFKWVNIY